LTSAHQFNFVVRILYNKNVKLFPQQTEMVHRCHKHRELWWQTVSIQDCVYKDTFHFLWYVCNVHMY